MAKKSVKEMMEETKAMIEETAQMKAESAIMEREIEFLKKENEHLKQLEELLKTLKLANETNQTLIGALPKVLGPEGAALCKISEQIIPGDKVVVMRYSPTTKKVYLSVTPDSEGNHMKLEEFGGLVQKAILLAKDMTDENGRLAKTGSFDEKKIEN